MWFQKSRLFSSFAGHAVGRAAIGAVAESKVVYVVRSNRLDDRVLLEVPYETDDVLHLKRSFFFNRSREESCATLCSKIEERINSTLWSKYIKKFSDETVQFPVVKASLHTDTGHPVCGEIRIEEALRKDMVLRLSDQTYQIVINPPTVSRFILPDYIVRGRPVFFEIQYQHCSLADCLVQWFMRKTKGDSPPSPDSEPWQLVHEGCSMTFESADSVGQWVKVRVVPRSSDGSVCGREVVKVLANPIVDDSLDDSPLLKRHELTAEPLTATGAFRAVSYNVLANFYVDSDYSRNYLFPYCPPQFLRPAFRRALLLWELVGYNADLICLQEVDRLFYNNVLVPMLCDCGDYESSFLQKFGHSPEGVAIFYRRTKFQLVEDLSLASVSAALFDLGEAKFGPVVEAVRKSEKFSQRWSERNQCLLALLLRCVDDPTNLLLASTTHLHSKPCDSHIRLLQAAVCMRHLARVRTAAVSDWADEAVRCGVVFCGDLNSTPERGVNRLITEGRVAPSCSDWYSQGIEEYFDSPTLEHDLRLTSAYRLDGQVCTNFTSQFIGCLDYIYYGSDHLSMIRSVPLPSHDELSQCVAIPSRYFPSDHVALVSDLVFNESPIKSDD